jgi:putative salt-induced outer membrane protein YdiY
MSRSPANVGCGVARVAGVVALLVAAGATPALAQDPQPAPVPQCPAGCVPAPPPSPVWTGSAGVGFSVTSGNSDTSNFNISFDAKRDPKTRTVLIFNALYLRATDDDEAIVDRTAFGARIERTVAERVFVFGQLQFLRDRFKDIEYLWAPTGGVGYRLIETPRVKLSADAGVGVAIEKNTGLDVDTSGALTAGDKLEVKLSPMATVTQGYSGLWKMDEFGDSIHAFTAGLAANLTARTQIKVELLDTYKTRPTSVDVEKNDVTFLTSFVFKIG